MIVLTDWMAGRMIRLGWVQKLDPANLPNADANLLRQLQDAAVRPGPRVLSPVAERSHRHRLQRQATAGRGRSVTSCSTRPDLKGRVTLLTEMRDTMGFMLRTSATTRATSPTTTTTTAIDQLQKAVDRGQIRRFTGNDYIAALANGDIAACLAWSGDVIQLQFDNPDIEFVIPEEGLSLWTDNMLVPNQATHKANAEALDRTTTTTRRSRRSWPPRSTTSARSTAPRRRWRRSTRTWPTTR